MKRIIIVVLCLLSITTTYSQDSVTIKVPDTSKITAKLIYDDAKAGIQGLAQALKAPAEHVYYILVRQQIVKSIVNTIIFLIICSLTIFFGVRFWVNQRRTITKDDEWHGDSWDDHATIILSGMFFLVGLIACMVLIGEGAQETITGFVNPEYGAIKDIFDFVKGK